MELVLVDKSNYKEAIRIQKSIFPHEDGTLNVLASLDRDLFIKTTGMPYEDDHIKYYLALVDGNYVGISGIYYYAFDTENAWLGWFGILPQYRKKGYGSELLLKTMEFASLKGFKNMRIYCDYVGDISGIHLYEKNGFIGEKYTYEKLAYDCRIYSKSLTGDKVTLWNNKNLNLSYQSKLDHMDNDKINEIVNIYDNMFKNIE